MIAFVNWQYIILNGDSATGYRVKRRSAGAPPPVYANGTDAVNDATWNNTAPPEIIAGDRTYTFAFWSITGKDMLSPQQDAYIETNRQGNTSHPLDPQSGGGLWVVTAKAYYVWKFGLGGGDNVVLIDAFDVQAGDFIPDDFVDASPDDQNLTLTTGLNNGLLDTDTAIAQNVTLQIKARDILPSAHSFGYWLEITSLTYSNDPELPASVSSPGDHDITVHYNDIVVAFAFYNQMPRRLLRPPHYEIFDSAWWIKTHGGLIFPAVYSAWLAGLEAVTALVPVINRVSPSLKRKLTDIVIKQLSIVQEQILQEAGHGH